MSEDQANAERLAAELVTEHLGGSLDAVTYGIAVHVVAAAFLRGVYEGRMDGLAEWDRRYLTARERRS
jgi:hypothetical protein